MAFQILLEADIDPDADDEAKFQFAKIVHAATDPELNARHVVGMPFLGLLVDAGLTDFAGITLRAEPIFTYPDEATSEPEPEPEV